MRWKIESIGWNTTVKQTTVLGDGCTTDDRQTETSSSLKAACDRGLLSHWLKDDVPVCSWARHLTPRILCSYPRDYEVNPQGFSCGPQPCLTLAPIASFQFYFLFTLWSHSTNARWNRCQEDLNSFPLDNWRRPPGRPCTTCNVDEDYPAGPEI